MALGIVRLERQRLLLNELNHRVKNILAVVQAVASDRYGIGYSGVGYRTADVRAVPLAAKPGGAAGAAPLPDVADTWEREVPERARWIRMILCELNRLSSHFMFTGAFGTDSGVFGTAFTYAFRWREEIMDLFEEITGDRLMYAYFRPGGLAWDVPTNFVERVREVLQVVRREIADIDGLFTKNEIFLARTKGVGVISRESNKIITTDPDYAAEILLGQGKTKKDLINVESIYKNLQNDPDKEVKTKDFEVCFKHHTKGEKWDNHYHKQGTEINYLVKGKMICFSRYSNTASIEVRPY